MNKNIILYFADLKKEWFDEYVVELKLQSGGGKFYNWWSNTKQLFGIVQSVCLREPFKQLLDHGFKTEIAMLMAIGTCRR